MGSTRWEDVGFGMGRNEDLELVDIRIGNGKMRDVSLDYKCCCVSWLWKTCRSRGGYRSLMNARGPW
jgi:hypothetical protein